MKKTLKIYILPPPEHNFWHFCKIEMRYRQTLVTQFLHAAGGDVASVQLHPKAVTWFAYLHDMNCRKVTQMQTMNNKENSWPRFHNCSCFAPVKL